MNKKKKIQQMQQLSSPQWSIDTSSLQAAGIKISNRIIIRW
jgi:hypothetical protein